MIQRPPCAATQRDRATTERCRAAGRRRGPGAGEPHGPGEDPDGPSLAARASAPEEFAAALTGTV